MARVGIVFGLLLCGLTVVGLLGTLEKHPMQFIPMMLGIPVLFCGVVALNPHRRKYAMHAACVIAFLGAVAGGVRVIYCLFELAGGRDVNRYALNLVVAMSSMCAVFVAICLVSFAQTRRRKLAGAGADSSPGIPMHPPAAAEASVANAKSRESL